MATVLDEVGACLVSAGLSLVAGSTLFLAELPASPDVATALREYGGMTPEGGFGTTALVLEHIRLQVVCRGAADDYLGPRARAEAIYKALATQRCVSLSGTFYHGLMPLQSPFPIRRDQLGRWEIGFNVQADKEPSA